MPSPDLVPGHHEADRLEAEGHELLAQGHALLAKAARARARGCARGGDDDLVPLSAAGLGVRTRRKLEREGRLPVVKLGRQKYTRRSALVALLPQNNTAIKDAPPTAQSAREAARASYARGVSGQVGGGRSK